MHRFITSTSHRASCLSLSSSSCCLLPSFHHQSRLASSASASASTATTTLSKNQEKKLKKKLQKEQQQQSRQQEITEQQQNVSSTTTTTPSQNFVYPSFVINTDAKKFLQENFEVDPETQKRNKIIIPTATTSTQKRVSKLGGRVTAVRDMGKVTFLTLKSDDQIIQVMYSVDESLGITKEDIKELSRTTKMGDIVGVEGTPGVTKKGEPSIIASKIQLLSKYAAVQEANCPSLTGYVKPSDPDILYRYRFVDLMANSTSQQVFRTRARVLSSMRKFLDDRGFVEVETPVFHTVPSGAAARPFRTFHESNESDLFLRVAPELYLKQCVVGGLERVYEIGRVFRNEDTDRSHNPEFTSCEFYQAFATYRELMPMTEEMIRRICIDALGTTKIQVATTVASGSKSNDNDSNNSDQTNQKQQQEWKEIDFAQPFKVINIIPELESLLGLEFPRPISDLDSEEGSFFLKQLLSTHNIPLPQPASPAKLFDKLIDHFITDRVVEPAFIVGHPTFMSPLAKEDPDQPGVSERFELFVNGMEICNSYSELNDPVEQKHRFEQQLKQRVFFKDEEAQCVDETFLKALQVGLPPTAGWGMGIDRLVMLLCKCSSIRDVILFPLLRSAADSRDSKRKREAASFFSFDPFMTKFCLNSLEAEFMKRDQSAAGLVRNVHKALDVICGPNTSSSTTTTSKQFETSKSLCAILSGTAMDALNLGNNNNSPSSSTSTTTTNHHHQTGKNSIMMSEQTTNGKHIVTHHNKKDDADCGVLALIVLGGLRESPYVVQEKAERLLLDAAFKALCDPSVASSWWWRR